MQLWTAFCLAIMAGGYFGILSIQTNILSAVVISNASIGIVLAFIGNFFFRSRLQKIEITIKHGC